MIDWGNLAANSLWILGCSLALALFSYATWEASATRQPLGTVLKQSRKQALLNLAAFLFCLGLAATSKTVLEIGLWGVLGVISLALGIRFLALRS